MTKGVDLLPTIHEGATVRAMEKKGIRTEKGEFNRWIKATNAVIRDIKKKITSLMGRIADMKAELAKPQAPDLVSLLNAYYTQRKAGAYSQKGKISNLKEMNDTFNYLRANGIYSLEDLERRVSEHSAATESLKKTLDEQTARMKAIKQLYDSSAAFQNLKPVYDGLQKIKFEKPRAKYKAEHEAIVTPEEWEQVQELIDRRPTIMKGNACPFYNLFHGLVYCATCGKSMQVRYEKVGRTGKNCFTGEMGESIDRAYYICQTYNRLGRNACTSHKIEARDLYNLVLKDIQELAAQAMKDADAFYQRLSSWMERRYLVDASQTEKERKRLEARNQEIDGMFLSLYTDKAKGILTEQRFMKLTAALE